MPGAVGSLELSLGKTNYEVWALSGRPTQVEGKHESLVSVRLGPDASGGGTNGAKSVRCAPTALR